MSELDRRLHLVNETILEEAARLVDGDREDAYGHPADTLGRAGRMWAEVVGVPVSAEQVALCMVLVKVAREVHKHARDNIVDAAGFLRALERVRDRQGA